MRSFLGTLFCLLAIVLVSLSTTPTAIGAMPQHHGDGALLAGDVFAPSLLGDEPGDDRPDQVVNVISVNSTRDLPLGAPGVSCRWLNSECTLRAAVQTANENPFYPPAPVSIHLVPRTFSLTVPGAGEDDAASGDLDLKGDYAIFSSSDPGKTIIESTVSDRVFHVHPGADIVLDGLSITNGKGVLEGGGLLNDSGSVTLQNSVVSHNETLPSPFPSGGSVRSGGGIHNFEGTLRLDRTTVRDNYSGSIGGGIASDGRDGLVRLRISHSTIVGNEAANSGGGVHVGVKGSHAVSIDASEIRDNVAGTQGGGLWVGGWAHTALRMTASTVAGNRAFAGAGLNIVGGGVVSATIEHSSFTDNSAPRDEGGGLRMDAWGCVSATLTNSLIARNDAAVGGGLRALSREELSITMTNSTVGGNSAAKHGGGLSLENLDEPIPGSPTIVQLDHVTMAGNSAPVAASIDAIPADSRPGRVSISSSIVAGTGTSDDCAGHADFGILSAGQNVGRDSSCGFMAVRDVWGIDPLLGPLADNGGPTWSHVPLAGSPAIDRGLPSDCPPTDQRGAPRPWGAGCDSGAVEHGAQPASDPPELPVSEFPAVPVVSWEKVRAPGYGCLWPEPSAEPSLTPEPTASAPTTPAPTTPPQVETPVATASPTAPASGASCICPEVLRGVPPQVISDAVANPEHYYGWRLPMNPNTLPGPMNPLRECLTLRNAGLGYHPVWNAPQWRVGCP